MNDKVPETKPARAQAIETDASIVNNQIYPATIADTSDTNLYKVYCYRWVVLIVYFFIMFSSGATYQVFIPFSVYMQKVYGITHVVVILTSFTFNGIYPISNFLIANQVIVYKGTKFAVF